MVPKVDTRNDPDFLKLRFDFVCFVVAFSIGHLEQRIACDGQTRVAE